MADSVVIRIDGDTAPYKTALSGLGKVTKASVKTAMTAVKGLAVATGAVTVAVGKLASEAANVGQAFESSFAKVETIMDKAAMSADAMRQSILDMSTETGVSAAELSESVYNAISATGDTVNAVSLVGSAAKLAAAGFTDSSSALSVLTTAMNAYGLSATEAEAISDSLITVQNLGVTTIAELSGSMGKAIASASAYGVNLGNVEASYVSLTKAGINTAESTTYISSMMKELGDDGTTVAKILKEKTGKSFTQFMADGNTLADTLLVLSDSVNGDSAALMNLWSSAEAGKASNAIVSQGLDTFNTNLQAIQNSADVTETAYSTMCNTLEHQTQMLKNNLTNFGISVYQSMESDLSGLVGMANRYVEDFNRAFDIGGIDGLASAVGDKIPELLELGSTVISNVADGIMRELPNIASRIMARLPSILNTAFGMSDTLITSLFQVASNVLYELVYMLPELIPTLIQGVGGVVKAVVKGVFGVIDSAAAGFADRLNADVSWERFMRGIDTGISGEISAQINADIDTSGATQSIADAIAELKESLTGIEILSDEERQTIMGIINGDIDPIITLLESKGVDTETAKTAAESISTAWNNFKVEVEKITGIENAKDIAGLIGEDYKTIVGALKGMGLSDADATNAANLITGYVDKVRAALQGTDMLSDKDMRAIAFSIRDDKLAFIELLKAFGLTDPQTDEIIAVYDRAAGSLVNKITSLKDLIYGKLTDGEVDSETVVNNLEGETASYFEKANAAIDEFIKDDGKAEQYKDELAALEAETFAWISTMAGQETNYVTAHLADLDAIMERVRAIVAEIDAAKAATTEVGKTAYDLTRAGATTDRETITLGVQYAYQTYKLDTQAIEDEAKAEKAAAGAAWEKGFMSDDKHRETEAAVNARMAEEKEALKNAYMQQLSELFGGITEAYAEVYPEDANIMQSIAEKLNIQDAAQSLMEQLENQEIDVDSATKIVQGWYDKIFGEGNYTINAPYVDAWNLTDMLNKSIAEDISNLNADNPLYTLFDGIFGSEALAGLDVDTSGIEGWLKTAYGGLGDNAADGYISALQDKDTESRDAGKEIAEESLEGAEDALDSHSPSKAFYKLGEYAGQGFVNGLNAKYTAVYLAAKRLANAAKQGATITLEVHSPSKAFERIGRFTGLGLERGMEESMRNAVKTASRLSENLLNAANLPFQQHVQVQGFGENAQAIISEGNTTNINLDGRLIAKLQGMNNSAVIAMQNARRATAIGGK